jgi:hypothetical protein
MLTDDVGEETDELRASWIDRSVFTPRERLDLQRMGY